MYFLLKTWWLSIVMSVFRRVFPMLRNPSCPCPALPIEIGQKPEFSVHDPGAGESNGWGSSRGRGNWGTLRIPREDWGTLGKIKGITTLPLRILLSFAKKTTGFLRGQCFTKLVIFLISFFLGENLNDDFQQSSFPVFQWWISVCLFFQVWRGGFLGKKHLSAQTVGKNTKDSNNFLVFSATNK